MHHLHSVLSEDMDLNQPPSSPIPELRSSLNIKVIVRRKIACREIIVRKYGEEGYNTIVSSEDPLILLGLPNGEVCIFVLI